MIPEALIMTKEKQATKERTVITPLLRMGWMKMFRQIYIGKNTIGREQLIRKTEKF